MIKAREGTNTCEIKVDVVFRDEKGKEITKWDEGYEHVVKGMACFIGMLVSCGSNVEGAMEDIRVVADKLAMQMAVGRSNND